jgi:hypothetical protein
MEDFCFQGLAGRLQSTTGDVSTGVRKWTVESECGQTC